MNLKITLFFLCLTVFVQAQIIIDFEEYSLEADTFLDGRDGSMGFSNDFIFLPNSFNPEFKSWNGWAISNKKDTLDPGFKNQFSAIAGSGVDGSSNFAVSFDFGNNNLILQEEYQGSVVNGMYITNSAYSYLVIRDGNQFSKKFGGSTGNDPDFFLLTIEAYYEGDLTGDKVDFYLADYRSEDNEQDYIVKDWTYVDLSSLGPVDSLSFWMSSSDEGMYGINTPLYFCVDNIDIQGTVSNTKTEFANNQVKVFPNPSSDYLQLDMDFQGPVDCQIRDMSGKLLLQQQLKSSGEKIKIQSLSKGAYLLQIKSDYLQGNQVFLKQ